MNTTMTPSFESLSAFIRSLINFQAIHNNAIPADEYCGICRELLTDVHLGEGYVTTRLETDSPNTHPKGQLQFILPG